jgi:hypothetical protein
VLLARRVCNVDACGLPPLRREFEREPPLLSDAQFRNAQRGESATDVIAARHNHYV